MHDHHSSLSANLLGSLALLVGLTAAASITGCSPPPAPERRAATESRMCDGEPTDPGGGDPWFEPGDPGGGEGSEGGDVEPMNGPGPCGIEPDPGQDPPPGSQDPGGPGQQPGPGQTPPPPEQGEPGSPSPVETPQGPVVGEPPPRPIDCITKECR